MTFGEQTRIEVKTDTENEAKKKQEKLRKPQYCYRNKRKITEQFNITNIISHFRCTNITFTDYRVELDNR